MVTAFGMPEGIAIGYPDGNKLGQKAMLLNLTLTREGIPLGYNPEGKDLG